MTNDKNQEISRSTKPLPQYDAGWEADFSVIGRMRAAFADIPDDELEAAVKQANEEARAELRAERAAAKEVQAPDYGSCR